MKFLQCWSYAIFCNVFGWAHADMLMKANLVPCRCTEKGKHGLRSLLIMITSMWVQKVLPYFHLGNPGLEYIYACNAQMANTCNQKHFWVHQTRCKDWLLSVCAVSTGYLSVFSSQQCSCHWSKTSGHAGMYQELLLLPGLVAEHPLGLLDMCHIPFAQSNYFLSWVKRGDMSENRVASRHRQREKKRLNLCLAPFVSAYTVNCHVIQVEKRSSVHMIAQMSTQTMYSLVFFGAPF